MAKHLCAFLCVSLCAQIVLCQFVFLPQRENRNEFFGQVLMNGPKRIRDRLSGFFNARPDRPAVINTEFPQGNVYPVVMGPDQTMPYRYDNNDQNFGRPVRFPTSYPGYDGQYNGNVNFQPNPGNDGFQQNVLVQPPQGGEYQGVNNQENTVKSDPENDAVNFDDEPKVPETTTLLPLTPVPTPAPTQEPTPQTGSRNSFTFQSTNQGVFMENCQTIDGGVGSCISVFQCPPYLAVIQESRTNPAAVQILRRAHCGFEGSDPKVCCPRPGIPSTPIVITTTTTPAPTPEPTTAPAPKPTPVPTPSSKTSLEDFVPALPDPPICGLSNASFSRVVGGVDAKLGDFPWMALLGYKSKRTGSTSWLCGGSLISSRHVLTAAHCIHNHEEDLYVVRLGELDLAREDEGATPVDFLIKYKVKHEQYSPTSFTNDIGIIVLDHDATFSDLIRPICIPKDSELRARSFEDYNPMIAGWGHTEFRGPAATHLQVLQLPVVSNEYCVQAYSAYKAQKIDERVLCAGFKKGGKDACQGDSGGPLMQPIWNKDTYKTYFYQIGVVSYGKKCAEANFPGVYSRVTHFIPWIEEKVIGRSST